MTIKKAAVIGAGTMGMGIAAHLANAGVRCVLLDIVPAAAAGEAAKSDRSRLAREAIQRALATSPPAFQDPLNAALIEPGNVEDDLGKLADCDWIIEAVSENLEIKRSIYARIARARRSDAIVSSNTSGISLRLLVEGLDRGFRERFLITHFFNPPRYMHLLEVVQGPETLDAVVAEIERFSDVMLGKGIVRCKDTPNFIANRIGVFAMGSGVRLMEEEGLTIEEVDAITGPPMARPKTASFRLQDLVGIDVSVMVMDNVHKLLPEDESRADLLPPELFRRMVREGRLGRKTGAGFYKKVKGDILVLDLETFEYRPQRPVSFESIDAAGKEKTPAGRLRALVGGRDKAARYAWRLLTETLLYTARRIPEIADDIVSVDRALRWGFNWELGPFEAWDAIGLAESAKRLAAEGAAIPPLVQKVLSSGEPTFYGTLEEGGAPRRAYFDLAAGRKRPVKEPEGLVILAGLRERERPVKANASASIWEMGEGVLCVEFHSKMNTLTGENLSMIREAIDLAEREGRPGVVVGNQGPAFSAGANLVQLARAAEEKRWGEIEAMIREFHGTVLRMRYAAAPVVTAVQGLALGGGCELALAAAQVQASAETNLGLVELGVGLIPAGGGTRELAARAAEAVPEGIEADSFAWIKSWFQIVATAKVSQSAEEARKWGFLRERDGISANQGRTLTDARRAVLALAGAGHRPPRPRAAVKVAGRPGFAELQVILHQYHQGGFISDYDRHVATRFAYALTGGSIDAEWPVTEDYLLGLELEVFLGLLGEAKTLERIAHTLKTGKPLRN